MNVKKCKEIYIVGITGCQILLWRINYVPKIALQDLVRMEGARPGSLIWNNAWINMELVQREIFWEIHDGRSSLFWMDAWEQLPPIFGTKGLDRIGATMKNNGWQHFYQYWKER